MALTIIDAMVPRDQVLPKNLMILAMIFQHNEPSTSKKMAQHVVSRVHIAPEEVFEQGHVIDRKISTQQTQNWHS